MNDNQISVTGIVAAYKRPRLLRELLQSVEDSNLVRKVIVVDNGSQEEIKAVCEQAKLEVQYHRPEKNLGCGGGVARGLQIGLLEDGVTHFCIFDDDAQATSGAVDRLTQTMVQAAACVAVPLMVNEAGYVAWFPGLQDSRAWEVIRRPRLTPADYLQVCGANPVPITWAPWPVMAISAQIVKERGYPRDDFWLCAEDLEYSLRLTYQRRGVLVPTSVCRHLPPVSSGGNELGGAHYLRFCLLLQNLSYMTTRLPHAHRSFRHLPGNFARFFRAFGLEGSTLRDAWFALWRGAVRGKPAGAQGYGGFKERFLSLYRSDSAAKTSDCSIN